MISILCPSRGRPKLAKKMVETALSTAENEIEILLYLNADDPTLTEYLDSIPNKFIEVGPDRSPGYTWNLLAEEAKYEILFLIGDDVWFETPGWDKLVIAEFDKIPDKIACIYPMTPGLDAEEHNPHFCLHKNWIRVLGYFVPPHFWHWYVDTWTRVIAQKLNRSIIMENFSLPILLHYDDETAQRSHHFRRREKDQYLWEKTKTRWLNADVRALQDYMQYTTYHRCLGFFQGKFRQGNSYRKKLIQFVKNTIRYIKE